MPQPFDEPVIEAQLRRHGVYAACASGDSMRPMLGNRRDVIVVVPPRAPLKKRDVALYRDGGGRYVLHRVIAVRDGAYLMRGDNTFVREHIPAERVIGVLSSFNRKGRRIEVTSRGYRLYARLWTSIYPLRFVIHGAVTLARRIFRKIFRRRT